MAKLNTPSFSGFVKFLKLRDQRIEIFVILFGYVCFYILFINLYTLPSTLTDSTNYVYCAKMHHAGGYRPYGYSSYLGFLHSIYSSIGFVTFSQFLLTALSTLFFLYTIKYFFKLQSGIIWYVFTLISVASPPTLYMAHSLLSDSLFCALTVCWFTTGIWILYTRNLLMYAVHLLSLYWALEVRYSGLFYPIFTILIILLSFDKRSYQLALVAACLFVTFFFYKSTKHEMKKDFGVDIFSGFSGWQLVSNALHVVPYVELKPQLAPDNQTKMFLQFINQTDKSFYNKGLGAHFIWHKQSPLKEYLSWKMATTRMDYLHSWLLCGKDFSKFGSYIIKKHPGAFFNHYLLPNTWSVLYPPSDRGVIAKIEDITVDDLFVEYYGLEKGKKFSDNRSSLFSTIAPYLSVGNLTLWILFIGSIGLVLFKWKTIREQKQEFNCILFLSLFAIGYAAFNIFAGPYEYRYGIPIRPILIVLPLLASRTVLMHNKMKKG